MNKKILVISSFATDEINYKKNNKIIERPGGPGYWISQTLEDLHIKAKFYSGKQNARVKIIADGLEEHGSLLSVSKIPFKQEEKVDYIFVSTIADEFNLENLRKIRGDIILDVQGYARASTGGTFEIPEDIAKRIIILKATKKEFSHLNQKTQEHIKNTILLITDGAQGATIIAKERTYFFPSMSVATLDTIGAGDVFMVAFAVQYIQGNTITKAGQFAIRYVANYLRKKQTLLTLENIFGKKENIVIGAIHFPPLLGYKDFPGFDVAFKNALEDLRAFEMGGVDGVIIENNYDTPHTINVSSSVVSSLTVLAEKLKLKTQLPVGISVLWNDYRAALSIAKILDLQFIRIPVFVDTVETNYGIITGKPNDIVEFRKLIHAENVAMFTDIHVKHARLLSQNSLIESAKRAIENNADAIIITGKWTGNAPAIEEVKILRKRIGNFPVLIGSGFDKDNAKNLLKFANGAIASTSLKHGSKKAGEVNVKSYQQRIDKQKVSKLVESISA